MDCIYKAISLDGEIKSGKCNERDLENLVKELESKDYFLLEVDPIRELNSLSIERKNSKNRIKDKDISLISNEIYILLESGIHLKEALNILNEVNKSKNINKLMEDLIEGLDNGNLISETLENKNYPDLFSLIIKSGEKSGNMDIAFFRVADYYKKRYRFREKIISIMIYPIILLTSSILVLVFSVTKVFPELLDLFVSNNKELPKITSLVIKGANFISYNQSKIFIFLILSGLFLFYFYRSNIYKVQKFIYNLPLISKYLRVFYALRFIETQKLILSSGLNLVQSINISRITISNEYLNRRLEEIEIEVESGKEFSKLIKEADIFPKLIASMIKTGEESGNMLSVLDYSSKYLEDELEKLINRLTTLIEPVILIFITILIGSLVVSIITPMFELTNFMY